MTYKLWCFIDMHKYRFLISYDIEEILTLRATCANLFSDLHT